MKSCVLYEAFNLLGRCVRNFFLKFKLVLVINSYYVDPVLDPFKFASFLEEGLNNESSQG